MLYSRPKLSDAAAVKKLFFLILTAITLTTLSQPLTASAATKTPAKYKPPGEEICQALSTITGVAISPLLGVATVGVYQYTQAKTDEERAKLPWFASPLFWIPAFIMLAICFAKDTAGTALPTALKKPFDAIELVEHKISGLVATGAFVPIIASVFHSLKSTEGMAHPHYFYAMMDFSWLGNAIMIPISMIIFLTVCIASNAINVLILLSPFTTVDAALKSFRLLVLSSVTITALSNPWVGAAWSVVVIIFSYFIAGWSLRLSSFGVVFVWDFFTLRRNRYVPSAQGNRVFLGRKIEKVHARTYGTLVRDEKGTLLFHHRPWLVMPMRTLVLPPGDYVVGKGLFYSEIMKREGSETRPAILLPPRYHTHEQELVNIYGLAGIQDIGLRAAFRWLKELLGFKSTPPVAAY